MLAAPRAPAFHCNTPPSPFGQRQQQKDQQKRQKQQKQVEPTTLPTTREPDRYDSASDPLMPFMETVS